MYNGSWLDPNSVQSVDTGIQHLEGDICIVSVQNGMSDTNLSATPFVYNGKWYLSVNSNSNGGGPDNFNVNVLNS